MEGYDERTYGAHWAPYYDDIFPEAEEAVVDFLHDLAGTPPRALELAIGTGRIAIPMVARGVEMTGMDLSEEMIDKLRGKPGAEVIDIHMGDFAEVDVEGRFPLIYLAFNTLFALTDQDRQVRCFRNVADHLEPGGRFVIDCFVPDMKRFDDQGTHIGVSSISSTTTHAIEISIHEPADQTISSHMVRRLEDGSSVVLPVRIRYAWPSELDLMARLAGLHLERRFAWYDRRRFTGESSTHVSVYRLSR